MSTFMDGFKTGPSGEGTPLPILRCASKLGASLALFWSDLPARGTAILHRNDSIKTKSGTLRRPEEWCGSARGRTVFQLVRRARRRLLYNELFSQGANAASAALAAFILLLLIGTEILSWQWLLLIPVAAAAL